MGGARPFTLMQGLLRPALQVLSREMVNQTPGDEQRLRQSLDWVVEFALRALGVEGSAADPR